jgi:antirestriction protein ArdC
MPSIAYEKVTQAIIDRLEAGVVPWRCPWSAIRPQSIHKRAYHGINALLLSSLGHTSPYWATFKQIQSMGGKVVKGQKGTPVVFWKMLQSEDIDPITNKPKIIPFLRYYVVFNLDQTEGVEPPTAETPCLIPDPIAAADAIVDGYQDGPAISYEGTRAFYRPAADTVTVPRMEHFDSVPGFYDTLFHELIHSTGHPSRLNRSSLTDTNARFGSDPYAKEELVAEMGAAFLCSASQIDIPPILDNEAAYIASWLRALKNDNKLVITAASQAQKAADWILGNSKEA